MGMDVYGKNPKQNKTVDEFPLMKKFDAMEFKDKWKIMVFRKNGRSLMLTTT